MLGGLDLFGGGISCEDAVVSVGGVIG